MFVSREWRESRSPGQTGGSIIPWQSPSESDGAHLVYSSCASGLLCLGDRDEQREEHSPIPTVTFFASQETFAPEFRSLSRLMLASIFPPFI